MPAGIEIKYTQPVGCRAAVLLKNEVIIPTAFFQSGTSQIRAQIICGDRNVDCAEQYTPSDWGYTYNRDDALKIVGRDVNKVLGAMCLGCPFNSIRASAPTVTDQA